MRIISVEVTIGYCNPRHQVYAWIGKFADHHRPFRPKISNASEP